MRKLLGSVFLLLVIENAAPVHAQDVTPCPDGIPVNVTCYSGQDPNGAYYLMAMPDNYSGRLVLWNHGYTLSAPGPLMNAQDLGFPVLLLLLGQGYAVAASSYRPDTIGLGGWAVGDGAEDTENLRQLFIRTLDAPERTFVVGASEGGIVTASIIERFGTDAKGNLNYHGALPMCGPLAGGRRNWYGGFDLRVVYQYYCQNLPRPDEPPYDLFLGLDPFNPLSLDEVNRRINDCTGILLPADQRSDTQKQNLANILNVTKIPEGFLLTDMGFATFALQELSVVRTGGMSPVTNLGVLYSGSPDDDALNAGVFRSGSDPGARDWLSSAYDPTGNVLVPTLTLHSVGDGLVIVENENAYRQTLKEAGTLDNLFQAYTNANGHCQFSFSEFMATFQGLVDWVQTGRRPNPDQIVGLCENFRSVFGDTCDFNTTFEPDRFETRVADREP